MIQSFGLKSRDNIPNASSSYKILVKFLDSLSTNALEVTIFEVLLLLRRPKTRIHTFWDEGQDHQISMRSERESIRPQPAE